MEERIPDMGKTLCAFRDKIAFIPVILANRFIQPFFNRDQ